MKYFVTGPIRWIEGQKGLPCKPSELSSMPGIHIEKNWTWWRLIFPAHLLQDGKQREGNCPWAGGHGITETTGILCAQHGRRKEMIPQSCPLTSMCALWYRCTFKTYKWLGTVSWVFLCQLLFQLERGGGYVQVHAVCMYVCIDTAMCLGI